jgi:hypothetical protein
VLLRLSSPRRIVMDPGGPPEDLPVYPPSSPSQRTSSPTVGLGLVRAWLAGMNDGRLWFGFDRQRQRQCEAVRHGLAALRFQLADRDRSATRLPFHPSPAVGRVTRQGHDEIDGIAHARDAGRGRALFELGRKALASGQPSPDRYQSSGPSAAAAGEGSRPRTHASKAQRYPP